MMEIGRGEFGEKLCRVLGLPKNTVSLELKVAVDEIVTVNCEYYPELPNKGAELLTVLEEYYLCKKPVVLANIKWRSPYLDTRALGCKDDLVIANPIPGVFRSFFPGDCLSKIIREGWK